MISKFMKTSENEMDIKKIVLQDDGTYPNNQQFPLLLMRNGMQLPKEEDEAAAFLESTFAKNNWKNSWRNGVFDYHHYHSNTHEVLGVYSGTAKVQLGGPDGITADLHKGDVVVIPAGVAHKLLESDGAFKVVGAYPDGREHDMNKGSTEERPQVDQNIAQVPKPSHDPVQGSEGPLLKHWE